MERQIWRVRPSFNHPTSTLSVTLFDIIWVSTNPVERIFFYRLPDPSPVTFHHSIVPTLRHSLSLALDIFYPLAGRLVWTSHEPKPVFLYEPNDSVSLAVAEAEDPDSFPLLAGRKPFKASETRQYVPELFSSESESELASFQITLFPGHGLSVGMTSHHAFVDGKSNIIFMKVWSLFNKMISLDPTLKEASPLPQELIPSLRRPVVEDPKDIYFKYINPFSKSTKLSPPLDLKPCMMRGAFEISEVDVKKMRAIVMSKAGGSDAKSLHLSPLVLAYSFTIRCVCEAKKMESTIWVAITCDCRGSRCDGSLIPENYFGTCVKFEGIKLEVDDAVGRDGFAVVAKRVGELVKKVRKMTIHDSLNVGLRFAGYELTTRNNISIAGSPRFGVYKTDFGWGTPERVEITSIDRRLSIAASDTREGNGGVEIGVVLEDNEMVKFCESFEKGLEELRCT